MANCCGRALPKLVALKLGKGDGIPDAATEAGEAMSDQHAPSLADPAQALSVGSSGVNAKRFKLMAGWT